MLAGLQAARYTILDRTLQPLANAHLLYSDPPLTRAQCEDYISRHGVDEAEPVLVVGVGTLRSGLNQLSELQAVTKTTSPFLTSLQTSISRLAQMAKNKKKAQKKVLLDLNKIVKFLKNELNF